MIVVDTNIIAYLFLPTRFTDAAERLLQRDPEWCAPWLWRSEFRNVLSLYVHKDNIDLPRANRLQEEAESLMSGREYEMPSADVLELAAGSGRSGYDCEFVVLARTFGVPLWTIDRKLIESFPDTACVLSE